MLIDDKGRSFPKSPWIHLTCPSGIESVEGLNLGCGPISLQILQDAVTAVLPKGIKSKVKVHCPLTTVVLFFLFFTYNFLHFYPVQRALGHLMFFPRHGSWQQFAGLI